MKTYHTPGPWKAYNAKGSKIFNNWHIQGRYDKVAIIHESCCSERNQANAALIAAAPDMYEALKELKKQIGIWYPGSIPKELYQATEQANAAISKARGEL